MVRTINIVQYCTGLLPELKYQPTDQKLCVQTEKLILAKHAENRSQNTLGKDFHPAQRRTKKEAIMDAIRCT